MAHELIVLIDDDESIKVFVGGILKHEGYDFHYSASGKEALLYFKHTIPDIIICDIDMPEMNGWDLLQKVKSTPQLSLVPFVFLSACRDQDLYLMAKSAGADLMIPKDMGAKLIIAAIKSLKTYRE